MFYAVYIAYVLILQLSYSNYIVIRLTRCSSETKKVENYRYRVIKREGRRHPKAENTKNILLATDA